MTHRLVGGACLVAALAAVEPLDAEQVKSWFEVGSGMPSPLTALNINGVRGGQQR